jgi:NO-binding membrane sensor protein with MHYT domain
MGVVGIWCMHFIGNRAIILGDGDDLIQLSYSPGYTILSVFCPILGLTAAFSAAEWPSHSAAAHWAALCVTGLLAGGSIAAMHYVGNLGITNYILSYSPRFLAASIIIAVGDCMLVLVLFYTLREKWISSWWKRLLCGILLAGGVTSMHFTASTHCTYTLVRYNTPEQTNSRNIQVIIAGTICGATAVIVFFFQHLVRMRTRAVRARSQKVTLACVVFNPDGRILVTTEGVLPSREITDKYNHRTFDEDFNTAHPMFQWIFRVTYNWGAISDFVPRMQSQMNSSSASTKDTASVIDLKSKSSSESSTVYDSEAYSDYTVIFRERFCMAAVALAASMHVPLERLGVLYDRVVETGTLKTEDTHTRHRSAELRDVEAVLHANLFGKGQVMFITRQASETDVDKLLNAGYKFASILHVSRTLAQAMQIPTITLDVHLADIKRYLDNLKNVEKTGTWLALFAMIPKPNQKGFEIVVDKDYRDQLPDVQLLPQRLNNWQIEMMHYMDGYRAATCFTFLDDHIRRTATGESSAEIHFALILRNAITRLFERVPSEWTREARFSSQQLTAHYSRTQPNRASSTTLYAFTIIVDMHTSIDPRRTPTISRIPLSFFDTRQRCYPGSPDHAILAREIVHMFGPLLSRKYNKDKENQRHYPKRFSANSEDANNGNGRGILSRASMMSGGPRLTHYNSTDKIWSAGQEDSTSDQYELIDTANYSSRPVPVGEEVAGANDSTRSNSLRMPGMSNNKNNSNRYNPRRERDRHNSAPSSAWGNGGILVSSETVIETDSNSEIFGPASSAGEDVRSSSTTIGGPGGVTGISGPRDPTIAHTSTATVINNKEMGTRVAISATKPEMTFVDHLVGITKARNVPAKPDMPVAPSHGLVAGTASPGLIGLPESRLAIPICDL